LAKHFCDFNGFFVRQTIESAALQRIEVPTIAVSASNDCDACAAMPDTAIHTTACELVNTPERFNNKIVTVRGRILIAFEDFRLDTAHCDDKNAGDVWLEYGRGPKKQPTTWCCGDMVPRDSLRLVEDRNFKTFHRYLTAESRRKGCHEGGCYLYEVTATLTGRFDAVDTVTCPDGRSLCPKHGGFGHFGSFSSRIVIGPVSDVKAVKRLSGS
jgi:hypothetical protein